MTLPAQFVRFALVGAAGFVVDVGVLYLGLGAGLDLYTARAVSFVAAATFTWVGNRRFTFERGSDGPTVDERGAHTEWFRYVAAMAAGGAVNYGVYAAGVALVPLLRAQPWLAVAAGTACGMVLNFVLARRILHRPAS